MRLTTQGRTSLALTPEEEPLDITVSKNTLEFLVLMLLIIASHEFTNQLLRLLIAGHWIVLF